MISPGLRIGRYEVGKRLGKGGFGVVHVARDVDLDREIAIKVLKPEYVTRPQIVQRFLQEARAAAKIGHAGIVTVFECGQIQNTGTRADGNAYIAMELLVGQSLSERLLDGGRMPIARALGITRQLAAALAAAHAAGIVHRDLKPDNVYLVPDVAVHGGERVKILDFGVAKLIDPGYGVNTHSQMMLGTPKYMAPEQARSAAKVDHRGDIYTLGCMLFEMLTGRTPFSGDSGEQIIAHQKQLPPSARAIVPEVSTALDELIRRMLAKSPDDRPQSATDIADALADLADEPDTAVRTPIDVQRTSAEITTVQEPTPRARMRRLMLIAIGLAGFVIVGVVVVLLARSDAPRRAPVQPVASPTERGEVRPPPPTTAEQTVPIDAPPFDDTAPIRSRCKEAIANFRWSDAIACAEELREKSPIEAEEIWNQAHAERRAEASYRRLQRAIKDNDVRVATMALRAIDETSVYRKDAVAAYEAAFPPGRSTPVAPPRNDPPREGPCASADEAFAKGQEAFGRGRNADALVLLEHAYTCKGDARVLQLAFAAACKARNLERARFFWKKMTPGMQQAVASFCPNNGIRVEQLNAP